MIEKYINIETLSKNSFIIGDYISLADEIVYYLENQNKREFLLNPDKEQMNMLKLINNVTQLESDTNLMSKHLNLTNQQVKQGGYDLRNVTKYFSQFVEIFFFKDEFQHGDYINNELKDNLLNHTSWNTKLIIEQNNIINPYDFDGKIANTNIYVDIKGRYESCKSLKNIDKNSALYLDEKTILKYYCRKVNDNADIWFAIYHNYGLGNFGINFIDFNTILSYLDIRLNPGCSLPTTDDILTNKFTIMPLTLSVNENKNVGHKLLSNTGKDIIEITSVNNTTYVNFNYKVLSCERSDFIKYLTKF